MSEADEINAAVGNDRRVLDARKKLDKIVHHIQCDVRFDGNAGYYLTVLPPLLRKLEDACNELTVAEATAELEARESEKRRREEECAAKWGDLLAGGKERTAWNG